MSAQASHSAQVVLQKLARFVRLHNEGVRSGKVDFSLNPGCLRVLHQCLSLAEERGRGLTDEERLLSVFVSTLQRLKVEPSRAGVVEDRQSIDLTMFRALRALSLDLCKPFLVTNLAELRRRIEFLTVQGCLNSLGELLDFQVGNEEEWAVTHLNCSRNNIPEIDLSARFLTKVVKLDLSHNLLQSVRNLQHCINLESLNLSFNRVKDLSEVYRYIGNIKVLNLRNNFISSTDGLDRLYSLERLDISHNQIAIAAEINKLAKLPMLRYLWVDHNPVAFLETYRLDTLTLFAEWAGEFLLDGTKVSRSEYSLLKKVQAARHRQQMLSANAPPDMQTHNGSPADSRSQAKKKKAVKRVVTIPTTSMAAAAVSPVGRSAADWRHEAVALGGVEERDVGQKNSDEAIENFQKKVNELREEGGTKWLLIWNEMEHMQAQAGAASAAGSAAGDDSIVAPKVKKVKKKVRRRRKKKPAQKGAEAALTGPAATELHAEQDKEEKTTKEETEEEGEEGEETVPGQYRAVDSAGEEENDEEEEEESDKRLVREDDDTTPGIRIEDMDQEEKHGRDGDRIELTSGMLATTPQRGPIGRLSSSPSARKHLASPLRYDADDLPSEEFFVERIVEGEYEARIVVINEECIREADIEGNWVLQIEGKFVDSITPHSEDGLPCVRVVYRVRVQQEPAEVLYQAESEEAVAAFVAAAKGLLDARETRAKCMSCGAVFLDGQNLAKCVKCKSTYVVVLHQKAADADTDGDIASGSEGTENTGKEESHHNDVDILDAEPVPRQVPATTGELEEEQKVLEGMANLTDLDQAEVDLTAETIGTNMELYFRLKFFSDSEEEAFLYLLRSSYLPFSASLSDERVSCTLLTTEFLYILVRTPPPKAGFVIARKASLAKVRRVVCGFGQQWLRLLLDDASEHLLVTREHEKTHAFVDLLMDAIRKRNLVDPAELVHYNQQLTRNMSMELLDNEPFATSLDTYVMAYLRQPGDSYNGCYKARHIGEAVVPVSVVMTKEKLLLCREDYSCWPVPEGVEAPSTPQFTILHEQAIGEVLGIEVDCKHPSVVAIVFEQEDSDSFSVADVDQQQWDLYFTGAAEKARFVKRLSRRWQEMYMVELTTYDRGE